MQILIIIGNTAANFYLALKLSDDVPHFP